MTTKLNLIKTALRESIEIASKATEGPWTLLDSDTSFVKLGETGYLIHATPPAATFISHARTMTPLACKALLTAIEGLEELAETVDVEAPDEVLRAYAQDTEIARKALSSITSQWPDV